MLNVSRAQLKRYAAALEMWSHRFDAAEIAEAIDVPEALVQRWITSYREMMRGAA